MDYSSMTYTTPIRDAVTEGKLKPHQQLEAQEEGGTSQRAKVSRSTGSMVKVVTAEEERHVNVS